MRLLQRVDGGEPRHQTQMWVMDLRVLREDIARWTGPPRVPPSGPSGTRDGGHGRPGA